MLNILLSSQDDYYKRLNVKKTATPREIKKSYIALVKKYHPDKNPGNTSVVEIFKGIQVAYQVTLPYLNSKVLSNQTTKEIYDKYGEEGLKQENNRPSYSRDYDPFSFLNFGSFFFHQEQEVEEEYVRQRKVATLVIPVFVSKNDLKSKKKIKVLRILNERIKTDQKRKCRCRLETHTENFGPGSYRMTQQRVCDECYTYEFKPKSVYIDISLDSSLKINSKIGIFTGIGDADDEAETGDLKFIISHIS
ncbi:hypothetical protein HZS_1473 [Henneguya salminicola]|nr:hypothetical protein HZS_1473 [Henneguya salminicola]